MFYVLFVLVRTFIHAFGCSLEQKNFFFNENEMSAYDDFRF